MWYGMNLCCGPILCRFYRPADTPVLSLCSFLVGARCPYVQLTRDLVVDVAHGMAYLHQHSTWHGDLKSLNILLDADCRAKVDDDAPTDLSLEWLGALV